MALDVHNGENSSLNDGAECNLEVPIPRRKVTSQKMANHKRTVLCSDLLNLVVLDYMDNKRKTLANLAFVIRKHLEPYFGNIPAENLRSADAEDYKSMRRGERAARATINNELSPLIRGGKLALRKELITKFPTIQLYNIGNSNRREGFFEEAEYLKHRDACPLELRRIFTFGYFTGWREGEILGLKWSVNYDGPGRCIRIFVSKNGKGRVFPLGVLPELEELITEMKRMRDPTVDWMFPYHNARYATTTFNRHWRDACEASGVERHFHDLRRTAVRNLVRAGVPRSIAKTITGHESDNVFERYDIVNERDIRDALGRLNEYRIERSNAEASTNPSPNEPNSRRVALESERPSQEDDGCSSEYTQIQVVESSDGPGSLASLNDLAITSTPVAIKELHEEVGALKREQNRLGKLLGFIGNLFVGGK